jgi:hypothetical protein
MCSYAEAGLNIASDAQAITAEMRARTASFRTIALTQSYAPAALVASLTEEDLLNQRGDEVITVLVMPFASIPAPMADLLRQQPIDGPIPAWIPDDATAYRSLKQIRHGFVVKVTGNFTKPDITAFANSLDLDLDLIDDLLNADPPRGVR